MPLLMRFTRLFVSVVGPRVMTPTLALALIQEKMALQTVAVNGMMRGRVTAMKRAINLMTAAQTWIRFVSLKVVHVLVFVAARSHRVIAIAMKHAPRMETAAVIMRPSALVVAVHLAVTENSVALTVAVAAVEHAKVALSATLMHNV